MYFFLGDYHDMDLFAAPEPESFIARVAELHSRGKSPTGKFGFPVPTVCGIFERTVTWESSWAECFANQLKDVIKYDNETNGPWPQFDAACIQIIDKVVPRLLGALQSNGRSIEPALIHGDLCFRSRLYLCSQWNGVWNMAMLLGIQVQLPTIHATVPAPYPTVGTRRGMGWPKSTL
jgi:protein-ribulosamine 3-kinase